MQNSVGLWLLGNKRFHVESFVSPETRAPVSLQQSFWPPCMDTGLCPHCYNKTGLCVEGILHGSICLCDHVAFHALGRLMTLCICKDTDKLDPLQQGPCPEHWASRSKGLILLGYNSRLTSFGSNHEFPTVLSSASQSSEGCLGDRVLAPSFPVPPVSNELKLLLSPDSGFDWRS